MSKKDPIVVTENFRPNGELKSIYQYIDKNDTKTSFLIPKWLIGTASFICAFILISFIAALVVVYFAPRHSLHQETCIKRSCINGFGLKCINNTCLCESGYIYIDKCRLKKNYMEKCNQNILCKDNTNMICIDGVCKCDENKFWNDSSCIDKSTFNQSCNSNEQCLEEKMLFCDNGKCRCNNITRYWDGTSCYPKRTFNEKCSSTSNCREWENLSCIKNLCKCISSQYWDHLINSCRNKLYENNTCSQQIQCFSPMNCTLNNLCQCGSFEYHNITTLECLPQKTHLELTCEVDYNCRVDRYLECRNGLCQCINDFPLWSDGFNKCIVPRTYTQSCYDTPDCDSTQGLYCNDNSYSNCSCPKQLGYGICDCVRLLNGEEYYWNGYSCVLALGYNQTCTNASSSYMCKTLLEGTSCLGPYPYKCKCQSLQYYNYLTNKCEAQLSESSLCLQSDACRSDLGLSCQIVLCQCNSLTHYWNGSLCVPLLTYNAGTCSTDSQCKGNLICRLTGATCLCPLSVSNNKCDCPTRISGSEYYWNGTDCVPAASYGQTCYTASYTCQTITQLTQCDSSTQKCSCGSNMVWGGANCIGCDIGWTFYKGSCFRVSSGPIIFNTLNAGNIGGLCYGKTGVALAKVDNSYYNILTTFSGYDKIFIDAYKISSTGVYQSSDKQFTLTYVSPIWVNPIDSTKPCVLFKYIAFEEDKCDHDHYILCEYVLQNEI